MLGVICVTFITGFSLSLLALLPDTYANLTNGEARDAALVAIVNKCGSSAVSLRLYSERQSHLLGREAWLLTYGPRPVKVYVWSTYGDHKFSVVKGC